MISNNYPFWPEVSKPLFLKFQRTQNLMFDFELWIGYSILSLLKVTLVEVFWLSYILFWWAKLKSPVYGSVNRLWYIQIFFYNNGRTVLSIITSAAYGKYSKMFTVRRKAAWPPCSTSGRPWARWRECWPLRGTGTTTARLGTNYPPVSFLLAMYQRYTVLVPWFYIMFICFKTVAVHIYRKTTGNYLT